MADNAEFAERQAQFLMSREFAEFFLPLVKIRRQSHIEDYLDRGGDEHRVRVRELDDLIADAKEVCASAPKGCPETDHFLEDDD